MCDFLDNKVLGHNLMLISFYYYSVLCTKICADFTDKTIVAENHTDNIVKTAFVNNRVPTWADFQNFLEDGRSIITLSHLFSRHLST